LPFHRRRSRVACTVVIFQCGISCYHGIVFRQVPDQYSKRRGSVLVAFTVCTRRPYLALIVSIVLLLLPRTKRSKNYHYHHPHYIVIHQQALCVVGRQNTSLGPHASFQEINPRNILFCNVAQPASKATVATVVCPTWKDITQAAGFRLVQQ
jgi:hypothetical protein